MVLDFIIKLGVKITLFFLTENKLTMFYNRYI